MDEIVKKIIRIIIEKNNCASYIKESLDFGLLKLIEDNYLILRG